MPVNKVIVVGLDGLDPGVTEGLLGRGELPNLASLRERGGYARVATTTPAQTPVAWSTFATGTNPGGHGVFDFLGRDPKTYRLDLALNRYERKNAFLPPKVANLRRGVPFWSHLSDAGIASTVLRCPCTYPPDQLRGRLLAGMGVPDLRGGFGTATYYTAAEGVEPGEGEAVVRVSVGSDGTVATHLTGPRGAKPGDDARLKLTVTPESDGRRARLRLDGVAEDMELTVGRWTGWVEVGFKVGMLRTVRGLVRFFLGGLGNEFALYASPVNFAPASPLYPISTPEGYAGELAGAIGPYHTTGMVEDHAGLANGRFDEMAFLDQCETAWREREAMFRLALDRGGDGFVYCLFDTPDRVQHMLWRFREPDHPANRGEPPRPELARALEDQYRRGDSIVGEALERADDRTLVVAMSDHGFGSFRRGFNVNTWLHERGWLALKDGLRPGEEAGDLLAGVDWDRTKAYALGLSGVYLNLKGREGRGTVDHSEAESLKAEIARGLSGLRDPATGEIAVRAAKTREEVYSGPFAHESPDLLLLCGAGYRLSWGTSLGGVPAGVFEDNLKRWAGDHIVDPSLVPGVLFMNRPFREAGARLEDLAPTVLAALGVPKGTAMEGESLLP